MIKVLIVEDDPMVAEFNRRYLEKIEGFRLIASASTVKQALEIIGSQEVDLILLDIYMPGKSGLDLLNQILKLGKGIDVIMISAASDISSVKKALRYGAVDYLIKPFEFERFQAALVSYREEVRFLQKQEVLSQADLDKHLFYKEKESTAPPSELPKGLTRTTLKRVIEHIHGIQNASFSTEELAARVGISRVSMQKYVAFLTEIGALDAETYYGAVGRPVSKYKYVESKGYIIETFL